MFFKQICRATISQSPGLGKGLVVKDSINRKTPVASHGSFGPAACAQNVLTRSGNDPDSIENSYEFVSAV